MLSAHAWLAAPRSMATACTLPALHEALRRSNEAPIPAEIVLDCNLAGISTTADVALLAQECALVLTPLSCDRHIAALIFRFGAVDDDTLAARLDGAAAVLFAAHRYGARQASRIALFDRAPRLSRTPSLRLRDAFPLSLWRIALASAPAPRALATGCAGLDDYSGHDIVAWARRWPPRATTRRARDLGHLRGVVLLSLLRHGLARSEHAALIACLRDAGQERVAPGLYLRGDTPLDSASRLALGLATCAAHRDSIGLGPGAVSYIEHERFRNHPALSRHRDAVRRTRAFPALHWPADPRLTLVAETLARLLQGQPVPLDADAANSPARGFRAALAGTLRGLVAARALSRPRPGEVIVAPGDDPALPCVVRGLRTLCLPRLLPAGGRTWDQTS